MNKDYTWCMMCNVPKPGGLSSKGRICRTVVSIAKNHPAANLACGHGKRKTPPTPNPKNNPSPSCQCGISLLLDSHLVNIQQFLLKVWQTRFPRNSICSGSSHKFPFAPDLDSTLNLPGIPPCVWCTTKWHYTSTKQKSCSLV
jgi:hypothetical protein